MPRLDNLEEIKVQNSPFTFSATKMEDLGASIYTLVSICVDESGSVLKFKNDLEKCIANIVQSCASSLLADNLLLRLLAFDHEVREIHGYKLLENCNLADYDNCLRIRGSTALFDASLNAILSAAEYGKNLRKSDFSANGIIFVLTDGDNNAGKTTQKMIHEAIDEIRHNEQLESLITILIGVNVTEPQISRYLNDFHKNGGFDHYREIQDASPKSLAKLAQFVSQSISSQSQSINNGQSAVIPTI